MFLDSISEVGVELPSSTFIIRNLRIIEVARGKGALEGKLDLAIDLTDWRYYGDKNDPMVLRVKSKKGTSMLIFPDVALGTPPKYVG
ncbi:hypothetical protein AKJ64_04540 [candidate division MSBL1 archaeon SCGC-AAA259E17]|uniref:Uncharacterized protein n=1 Tax=candidate division MSBL1 archaeon SCGC-AAA259E17 TaxID=1698263 RepID=A0A133UC44_9EURY|nr:hypothetical protein AKJ64_04540 [candidate division MSBL1 archaeon SCGC-AAA259E17]